jgi:hypothetical protein
MLTCMSQSAFLIPCCPAAPEFRYITAGILGAPKHYTCIVMPLVEAESAAQINLDREYRTPKKDGTPHKPGKVWVPHKATPRETESKVPSFEMERQKLNRHQDRWAIFDELLLAQAKVSARMLMPLHV